MGKKNSKRINRDIESRYREQPLPLGLRQRAQGRNEFERSLFPPGWMIGLYETGDVTG